MLCDAKVTVSIDFGTHSAPSAREPARGTMMVHFSCDAAKAERMAKAALDELLLLRDTGPTDEDVTAAVETSAREHEEAVQTNCYWVERLRAAALPSRVRGSLAERFAAWEALHIA